MFRRPFRFLLVSRGPIRILSFGCPLVCLLGFASRVSVRFNSECPDVGAGSFPFVIDLEAFCASVGFVSVLGVGAFLFSECDYWAFCASVKLVVSLARFAGSSESAPLGIHLLPIFVHPVDSFRVLILCGIFLLIFDS